MQKVKQIFSNNNDEYSSNRRSSDIGSRDSTGYNTSGVTGNTATTGSESRETTADAANVGNRTSGLSGTGATTGSGFGSGANVHSGSTGVGSNIGRESSEISGGRGLGNAATAAGSTGTTGTHGTGGLASRELEGNNRDLTGDRTTSGSTGTGQGLVSKLTGNHTLGHDSRADSKFDPTGEHTTHDHKHLQHVVHGTHRHIEVEEVERQRDHQRHVHHLQHHVQPVLDTQVRDEVHHHQNHPVTNIQERHVNTDEDVKLFNTLGEKHRDSETHLPKERTVVDLGEKVNTTTHHHVHHVTQPVVEQEVHNRHRIHTTIPLSHTVHEAPIIHKSSLHEPVHMSDFLKGGGKLDSGVRHNESGLLATGDCDRSVDGLGEKLVQDLNLKPGAFSSGGNTTGSNVGGTQSSGVSSGLTGNRAVSGGQSAPAGKYEIQ